MSAAVVCRKQGLSYFDEIASPSLPPPYCSSVSKRLRHHHVEAAASSQHPLPQDDHPKNMSEWVDVFVSQMAGASTMDDAKARASRMLEVWEKFIRSDANTEAAAAVETLTREKHDLQKEYDGMTQELQQSKQLVAQYQEKLGTLEAQYQEQVSSLEAQYQEQLRTLAPSQELETVTRENTVLKRAVCIQHEQLRTLEVQYQQQLRTLETRYRSEIKKLDLEKYGLSMQLRQATTPNNSIVPGRFCPDGY